MNKLIFTLTALLGTTAATAQDQPSNGVPSSHKPNQYTMACLELPTRDCAFSAALQTVIAEEFGVERSKVLSAVARALIETGQNQQAVETLTLALDEARSVNLTLVTQEKITEIAPLFARAGDSASALALAQELQVNIVKQRTLINIARENILQGDLASAEVAFSQMSSSTRAFWQKLRLLPLAPTDALVTVNVPELEAEIRNFSQPDRLYRGLTTLAVLSERKGLSEDTGRYLAEADAIFTGLLSSNDRALSTAHRLRVMFDGGMSAEMIDVSYNLMLVHASRVRGTETLSAIAQLVGPVEAASGNLSAALQRLPAFVDVLEKARYVSSLQTNENTDALVAEISNLLAEVADIEGVYERDLVRLQLLEGAILNNSIELATQIISAIEDDDNQAKGLVLAAPLLQ